MKPTFIAFVLVTDKNRGRVRRSRLSWIYSLAKLLFGSLWSKVLLLRLHANRNGNLRWDPFYVRQRGE
jgi:hypothetical protein